MATAISTTLPVSTTTTDTANSALTPSDVPSSGLFGPAQPKQYGAACATTVGGTKQQSEPQVNGVSANPQSAIPPRETVVNTTPILNTNLTRAILGDTTTPPVSNTNLTRAILGDTTTQPVPNALHLPRDMTHDDAGQPMFHSIKEHPDWPDPESPLYHPIFHVHTPDVHGHLPDTPPPSPPPSPTDTEPSTDLDADANSTSGTSPRPVDPGKRFRNRDLQTNTTANLVTAIMGMNKATVHKLNQTVGVPNYMVCDTGAGTHILHSTKGIANQRTPKFTITSYDGASKKPLCVGDTTAITPMGEVMLWNAAVVPSAPTNQCRGLARRSHIYSNIYKRCSV